MSASADIAIRLQRAAFNSALASADIDAIARLLARDVVLVTGTDSAVIAGRTAQLRVWKREFAAAERAIYIRATATVIVSPVEPIALEQGRWTAVHSRSGEALSSGDYSAKWRETGGAWLLEAELFVTLA